MLFNLLSKEKITVELQWLEHLWDLENMFETGGLEPMSVNHSARSGSITGIYYQLFFYMKVYCVFSLESPH